MLLERKLPEKAIADFLERVDSSLRDPDTGNAAMWDAKHRVIYFPRREKVEFSGLWVRLDERGGFKNACPDSVKPDCGR